MAKKIRVFIKQPKKEPYVAYISDSLENLQRTVGGNIETVTLDDCVLIVNEDGLMYDLPFNCKFKGLHLVGTMLFVGTDGEDFSDVPMAFDDFKKEYPELWANT